MIAPTMDQEILHCVEGNILHSFYGIRFEFLQEVN